VAACIRITGSWSSGRPALQSFRSALRPRRRLALYRLNVQTKPPQLQTAPPPLPHRMLRGATWRAALDIVRRTWSAMAVGQEAALNAVTIPRCYFRRSGAAFRYLCSPTVRAPRPTTSDVRGFYDAPRCGFGSERDGAPPSDSEATGRKVPAIALSSPTRFSCTFTGASPATVPVRIQTARGENSSAVIHRSNGPGSAEQGLGADSA